MQRVAHTYLSTDTQGGAIGQQRNVDAASCTAQEELVLVHSVFSTAAHDRLIDWCDGWTD